MQKDLQKVSQINKLPHIKFQLFTIHENYTIKTIWEQHLSNEMETAIPKVLLGNVRANTKAHTKDVMYKSCSITETKSFCGEN